MQLRRTATTMTLVFALAGGMSACNGEDAGRAVDKGAKKVKDAGKKAAKKADKAVDTE